MFDLLLFYAFCAVCTTILISDDDFLSKTKHLFYNLRIDARKKRDLTYHLLKQIFIFSIVTFETSIRTEY